MHKKTISLLIISLVAVSILAGAALLLAQGARAETAVSASTEQADSSIAWQQKVDSWVLETAVTEDETEFLVFLTEQGDLSGIETLQSKEAKGRYVYEQLTAVAQRTQPALIAALKAENVEYRSYWVSNMIWVRGNHTLVQKLAQRPDVAHIYANPSVELDHFDITTLQTLQAAPQTPEWNLTKVNAPDVWADGVTGEGVVVGVQDTGFLWTHPALLSSYNGWVGDSVDHSLGWHDAIHENNSNTAPGNPCGFDAAAPCDDHGHGTHVLGTMVGDDGEGNQVGMAPGATWMACRSMEQGYGTPATYSECFEWFVAPYPPGGDPMTDGNPDLAPHVVNNSWSCPAIEGCTDPNIMRDVVDNVRAAGIATVQANSNAGSFCGSVTTPAAIYDSSISAGATNNSDQIAGFSARGPVVVDGSNRLKPDISAPGVSIRSTVVNGSYGLSNGTSMASPHIAGLTALLISANPQLAGDVDMLEWIMTRTAVPRTTNEGCGGDSETAVPNHTYGWGRIEAWAAYQAAKNYPSFLTLSKEASSDSVYAGGELTYTLTITNVHLTNSQSGVVLTDTLPSGTTFISATEPFELNDGVVSWTSGDIPSQETWQVELVVQIPLTTVQTNVVNALYGAMVPDGVVQGIAVETAVHTRKQFLPIIR